MKQYARTRGFGHKHRLLAMLLLLPMMCMFAAVPLVGAMNNDGGGIMKSWRTEDGYERWQRIATGGGQPPVHAYLAHEASRESGSFRCSGWKLRA